MDLNAQFEKAAADVQQLSARPSNDNLLKLYALYKQATEGDASGDAPGGFDFKAIAKYSAWKALKGKTADEAKTAYIQLVESLQNK